MGQYLSKSGRRRMEHDRELKKRLEKAPLQEVLRELTPSFKLKELVEAATDSFHLFRSFYKKTELADHPTIQAVSRKIQDKFGEYRLAIEDSITSAQNGHDFAEEGVQLCIHFEEKRGARKIKSWISTMGNLASRARTLALNTSKSFRAIRKELFKISKSIHAPGDEVGSGVEVDPERLQISSPELFSQALNLVSKDIEKLGIHVGSFANWWIDTETKLGTLITKVALLDPRNLEDLRIDGIRVGWENTRDRHLEYKKEIALLEDRDEEPERTGPGAVPAAGRHNAAGLERGQGRHPPASRGDLATPRAAPQAASVAPRATPTAPVAQTSPPAVPAAPAAPTVPATTRTTPADPFAPTPPAAPAAPATPTAPISPRVAPAAPVIPAASIGPTVPATPAVAPTAPIAPATATAQTTAARAAPDAGEYAYPR